MRKILFIFLCILLSPSFSQADDIFTEGLSKKLNISLSIPDGYRINKDENRSSPTYEIRGSKDSILMVSPYPGVKGNLDNLQNKIKNDGSELLKNSEEKKLTLITMKKDEERVGFYYTLTDKNPKSGDYKYLTQGSYLIDNGLIYFTFLNNDKESNEFQNILSILNSIKLENNENYISPFGELIITQNDLNKKVVIGNDLYLSTFQIKVYLNDPTIYDRIIPKLEDIEVQSIEDGGDKGSIIYLRYSNRTKEAYSFLSGVFYGGATPGGKEHPEEMFYNDDTIIILSYPRKSKLKIQIKEIIERKL